jgi:hypothetical protein
MKVNYGGGIDLIPWSKRGFLCDMMALMTELIVLTDKL